MICLVLDVSSIYDTYPWSAPFRAHAVKYIQQRRHKAKLQPWPDE